MQEAEIQGQKDKAAEDKGKEAEESVKKK